MQENNEPLSCQPPQPFSYSDGDAVEQYIIETLRHTTELEVSSNGLRQKIRDWPSRYHFSPERSNLLRHLDIRPSDRVLEVGAGCGAITRYLGETGASITSIEGSPRRAEAIQLRCRDLPNVSVRHTDFMRFEPLESYDWVLVIGVLEYASIYVDAPEPFQAFLEHAKRFLTSSGRLVVAIENQLGLKYFAGCSEDHISRPFVGLEDRYHAKTARTFGKQALATLLKNSGFTHNQFQYPYPDYKLPTVLLSDEGVVRPDFNASALVRETTFEDYGNNRTAVFDEFLALPSIGINGLLGDMANSFLVIASSEPIAPAGFLAKYYSTGRNLACASVSTFVVTDTAGTDHIEVRKEPVTPGFKRWPLALEPERVIYQPYPTLHHTLKEAFKKQQTGQIVAQLGRYDAALATLVPVYVCAPLGIRVISGEFFDLTPRNLLDSGSDLLPIDKEWRVMLDVPLSAPALRYLQLEYELKRHLDQITGTELITWSSAILPQSLNSLDIADLEIEKILQRILDRVVYPFKMQDASVDWYSTALDAAQRMLDSGEDRAAARTLIYGFFLTRDWRLANDAAILLAHMGLAMEGIGLLGSAAEKISAADLHAFSHSSAEYVRALPILPEDAFGQWTRAPEFLKMVRSLVA